MITVSITDFRSNQTKYLNKALNGEEVRLSSRMGQFKIMPVDDEEDKYVAANLPKWIETARLIREGKIKTQPARELLDEL